MTRGAPDRGEGPVPVAILGGGLAGLIAARILHRAGIHFHLFEARDRLGGRILTLGETGQPASDGFDLGPSWFWPHLQQQLAQLVAELGLQAMAQHTAGDMLFDLGPQAPPQRMRQAAYDQGSMRLVGGTRALIEALARPLPAACLWLKAEVTDLVLGADAVRLTVARAGQPVAPFIARHVISTVPPRLMAEGIRLDPAPDVALLDRWRATPTWMAPQAKIVAVYGSAFWRADGLSGMAQSRVGPLAEIHDATTASGKAALFGFVGLPARLRATMPQDDVIRGAVMQLARLFGPQAARPQATLVKDWAADRFTATAADIQTPAHPDVLRAAWVSGPWADRLTFAGSETSLTEPGYLAGAVEAASRVTQDWVDSARLRAGPVRPPAV